MKNIKRYTATIICLLSMGMLYTSCTDYLDKSPESEISETDAFKDFTNFQGFTEELYSCIPDFTNGYWNNSWNWGDDEIINTKVTYMYGYKIDNGDFWGWQSEYDGWQCGWMDRSSFDPSGDRFAHNLWKGAWYAIRKANMGLENLDKFSGTEEEKNLIAGQLYFFRGWFHFELMQYFGGLPYIDEVLSSTEKLSLPRLSYQECAEKAAEDFRKAADLLPVNWDETTAGKATSGKNQLRVTKIAALGYLGKDLLWAGSPLMNKESQNSATYNKDYCQRAAAAFGELLNIVEGGDTQFGLLPWDEYSQNFYTISQNGKMPGQTKDNSITEAIFRGPTYGSGWGCSAWGQAKAYGGKIYTTGGVCFLPTANYVNFYGMANGLPLTDANSGFDTSHPWKDRDPRFYNDIMYDGVKMVKADMSSTEEKYRYADLQTDGLCRGEDYDSRTGYYNCKFVGYTCNQWDDGYGYSSQIHMHIPWMRLSDIYLMYAEAAAQATGSASGKVTSNLSATEAINKVRERAGVADVNSKYLGSLDAFMGELQRERAVELAFEGHRFNDLRRWLLLDKAPYNTKTSQEFKRVGEINTTNSKLTQESLWSEKNILTRNFSEKHYWLPLKKSDCSIYLEFSQNPGW